MLKALRRRRVPRIVRRNRFLFHLVYEPAFLIAIGSLVALALLAPVFLLKIWIVSPKGFDPVVKVRALDFVQAAALRRSARKAEAIGDYKEAMLGWRGTVENNPANATDLRAALENATRIQPPSREWLGWSLYYGNWLMRLEQTNLHDVFLYAKVLDHYQLEESLVSVLDPYAKELNADQSALYTRALFQIGRVDGFQQQWKRHAKEFAQDRDMALFDSAFKAGWSSGSEATEARKRLDLATTDPATQRLANRLSLSVCIARNESTAYRAALSRLENDRSDRVPDHVRYWLLLAYNQRGDEAREQARKFVAPPESSGDAEIMARGLLRLGLRTETLAYLERHQEAFSYHPTLWTLRTQLLMEMNRWDDLRTVAVAMRQHDRLEPYLGGYSHFLEGLAETRQGRDDIASRCFAELAQHPIPDPVLAYSSASLLKKLGRPEIAASMLGRLEKNFSNQLEFWLQLQASAFDARQFDVLLAATKRAYEIAPGKLEYANNYAAALLVSREHPSEAIELTFRTLQLAPQAFETRLNHALALLQNARVTDAEPILRDLDDERRDAERETLVNLGWFEFFLRSGNPTRAKEYALKVDPARLLPPQAEWFTKSAKTLEDKK